MLKGDRMAADARGTLIVEAAGDRRTLETGGIFTFGRAGDCDFQLDPRDRGFSRKAGEVAVSGDHWTLTNLSDKRLLTVVDDIGLRTVVPPHGRFLIEGRLRVVLKGSRNKQEIVLYAPRTAVDDAHDDSTGTETLTGDEVRLNLADRRALVALFAGYLMDGARYDPFPRSYAAAASRLGLPRTTLVKRVEYIRTRFRKAGIPDMDGPNALTNLAEFVLARKLVTRADLRLIGIDPSGG